MERSMSYFTGIGAGLLCGVILVAAIVTVKKRRGTMNEFDERQIAARGKAFQYGFFAYLIYFACFGLVQEVGEKPLIDNFSGIYIGIFFATTTFAVNAIWNDAYLSFQDNVKRFLFVFIAVGIVDLLFAFRHIYSHSNIQEYVMNLASGIMLFIIAFTIIIKQSRDKEEEAE